MAAPKSNGQATEKGESTEKADFSSSSETESETEYDNARRERSTAPSVTPNRALNAQGSPSGPHQLTIRNVEQTIRDDRDLQNWMNRNLARGVQITEENMDDLVEMINHIIASGKAGGFKLAMRLLEDQDWDLEKAVKSFDKN